MAGPAAALRRAAAPTATRSSRLLDTFLERRAAISTEDQAPSVQRFREMIGRDEKMLIVFEWIRTAAKSDISVLILGPTGSGKEVVARMIHELSRRGKENFQAVNCAALPDTLFESEIFGYEKGAFTGAHDRKPGRLELADRGTLFLDEIGDLSLVAQAKLLRVLEDRRFERLGGQKVGAGRLPADLRDQPAARSVRARRPFPRGPLLPRQRVLDPAAVAARAAGRHSACSPSVSSPATAPPTACRSTPRRSRLKRWRGCRRIRGPATSASSKAPSRAPRCRRRGASSATPTSSSCIAYAAPAAEAPPRLPTLREAERAHIVRVLEAAAWNKKEAARVLEISRGTLYRKIVEYGLEPEATDVPKQSSAVAIRAKSL